MDQPTTSSATSNVEDDHQNIDPERIGSITTKTLKRMMWKLELERQSIDETRQFQLSDPVARTSRYTGMNRKNVEKILAFGETLNFEHAIPDRQTIQTTLITMYLMQNQIPTITELFNSLTDKFPIYFDIYYYINILVQMGYVFYKFPGRTALHVMEKKSVMFERYKYLKSILQYRNDKVDIVYVGLASLNRWMKFFNLERTLQTDPENILHHIFFTATAEDISNVKIVSALPYEKLKEAVKDWIVQILHKKYMAPGTVWILEDSKMFRDTLIDVPTWKSVKADMVEWLEDHNIPCDIAMSKAELLELIESCTDTNKNTFVVDNIMKTKNLAMLRLPQSINGLSIIASVIRFLNDNYCFKDRDTHLERLGKLINKITEADLKLMSSIVITEEKQQLALDNKIDSILDELIRKNKTRTDVEYVEDDLVLPDFSDTE